jgi:hypothetical protein
MSNHLPPDDDFAPEMTGQEAFARAMRIKLQRNREALKASGKSVRQSEQSETPVGPAGPVPLRAPPTAEELDQAILDRHPGLTKEDLERIAQIT